MTFASQLETALRRAVAAAWWSATAFALWVAFLVYVVVREFGGRGGPTTEAMLIALAFGVPVALLLGFAVPLGNGRHWAGIVMIVLASLMGLFGGYLLYVTSRLVRVFHRSNRVDADRIDAGTLGLFGLAFAVLGVLLIVRSAKAMSAIRRYAVADGAFGFQPVMGSAPAVSSIDTTPGAVPPGPKEASGTGWETRPRQSTIRQDPGAQPPA